MSNSLGGNQLNFLPESGRETICGRPEETLFQLVERSWQYLDAVDLRRFSGNRIDLCDASLEGANLYSADLTCARLRRARIAFGCLYGSSLTGADLQDADLRHVDFYRADLRAADLRRARLDGADLERAVLAEADLRGATFSATTKFPRDFNPDSHGMVCAAE